MTKDINIVPLRKEINEELVDMLERCLEDAKSGVMISGQICGTLENGQVVTCAVPGRNQLMDIAAVARLLHRLQLGADIGTERKD